MPDNKTKPFCIFTADPASGTRRYTEADLDRVVSNFNGGIKAAFKEDLQNPLVIGHEEDQEVLRRSDLPAAGWIDKIWREGPRLMAVASRVPETVRSWIDSGRYLTRSAEIYRDYKPSGAGPEVQGIGPALRRVALLGADIPHKKDLGGIEWECNREGESEYDLFTSKENKDMPGENKDDKNKDEKSQAENRETLTDEAKAAFVEKFKEATEEAKAEGFTEAQVDAFFESLPAEAIDMFIGDEMQFEAKGMMRLVPAMQPAAPAGAAPAGPPRPGAAPAGPPAQRFSETDEYRQMTDLIRTQGGRIRTLESDKKRLSVEKFVEGLISKGQITGATIDSVRSLLLKVDGVEKFAEGESTMDLVMKVLTDSLPKREVRSSPMTAGAARFSDSDGDSARIKKEYDGYAEQLRRSGTSDKDLPTVEKFCEWNGYEVPESLKTPATDSNKK